jgi:hypothetical protein
MTATATGDWRAALAAVERGIDDCLAALDRYESAFAKVLDERPVVKLAEPVLPPAIDWDAQLAKSKATADEVEQVLAEQEVLWGRWRSALANWQTMAARAVEYR